MTPWRDPPFPVKPAVEGIRFWGRKTPQRSPNRPPEGGSYLTPEGRLLSPAGPTLMLFEDEGLKRISIVGLYVCCFPLI
jgi:hypothetical protein